MNDEPIMQAEDLLIREEKEGSSATPLPGDSPPKAGRGPWGPWATIGWTFLCVLVMVVVQGMVLIGLAFVLGSTSPQRMAELSSSSLLLSMATLTSTPVVLGIIALLIYVRGCPFREYLAWRMPTGRQTLLAVGGLAILLITTDSLTYLLGRPIVPEVMIKIYETGWVVPLMIAMMVVGPLGEEMIFRGFFYHGIASSRWGPVPAIVLSSVAWALLHVQYDLYVIGVIVVMGFYLGFVRKRADSLPLNIILHCLANLIATIELIVVVQRRGG
jgi:membrane protease YdiL (CAAX protease family)